MKTVAEFLFEHGVLNDRAQRLAKELMDWVRQEKERSGMTRDELSEFIFPKNDDNDTAIDRFLESDDPPYWQFALARDKLGISPIEVLNKCFPMEDLLN